MKSKAFLVILAATLLEGAASPEQKPSAVIQIGHDRVAETFIKGGPLLETSDFKIQAGHREAPGVAEMHEHDTDIFYILEGSATLITGGRTVEPKVIGSGEIRGREVTGGDIRKLVKGDVIIIPSGVPHWFKEVTRPFNSYVVKVTK
jgi:quercetin dioxygenase-like cupin family protein